MHAERNALRAGLVRKAENWQWSSLWQREQAQTGLLEAGSVTLPAERVAHVNRCSDGGRVDGAATFGGARTSVWRGAVGGPNGEAFGVGSNNAAPRPAAERGR